MREKDALCCDENICVRGCPFCILNNDMSRNVIVRTRKSISTNNTGWNGYNSLVPNSDAVLHAENWIVQLFLEVVDVGLAWIQPNVIADANGDVVFEWWQGKKKLTVYIEDQSAEYVQVWGTNIHSEMLNGDAEPISVYRSLWLWLTG